MPASSEPAVSIVLPAYNRASFLPAAIASIRDQHFTDWELIVVDDGSTDHTRETVAAAATTGAQQIRYFHQANAGPAAARNAGIDQARGRYVAFYDSDDLWLPHHLAACVSALESLPDVGWAYGACRMVDLDSGAEIQASSFHPPSGPHPFMALQTRDVNAFHVITDSRAAECMIAHGLMCGLQGSVLRRQVFDAVRLRNLRVGEDQIFVVDVLKAGFTLGYFDDVHAVYHVHEQGTAVRSGDAASRARAVLNLRALMRAYEELPDRLTMTEGERRALKLRLANEYFWTIGYSILWESGERAEALKAFRQGIRYDPLDYRRWKTYLLAMVRRGLPASRPTSGA